MKITSVSTAQQWEQTTLTADIPVHSLMAEAVQGCCAWLTQRFPQPGAALFFCGKGNNGNDALWLAALLAERGWTTEILLTEAPTARKLVSVEPIRQSLAKARIWPNGNQDLLRSKQPLLVFDGLLGIGARGEPAGPVQELLAWWRQQRRPWHVTVSIDTPSGLDADSGQAAAVAFQADITLAIGTVKQGCLRADGLSHSGRIIPIPIQLVSHNSTRLPNFFDLRMARDLARALPNTSHKYRRGELAVFAGSPGFAGAAVLASRAALHAGAGVLRLFCHPDCYHDLALATPEVMVSPWDGKEIPARAANAKAWIIGPGFGTDTHAAQKFSQLLRHAALPLVLDADALFLLGEQSQLLAALPHPAIVTPHSGEFVRLRGTPIHDRAADAQGWTDQYQNTVLVLKGPNTLVAAHQQPPCYNGNGNPGLATAGSGDVLSGVLGALLVQGYLPADAARLGVFWHGLAGDLAAQHLGENSLLAGDLIAHLGPAWKTIRPLL